MSKQKYILEMNEARSVYEKEARARFGDLDKAALAIREGWSGSRALRILWENWHDKEQAVRKYTGESK